jgi:hypothetical protein
MGARELESVLLDRCTVVGKGGAPGPVDQCEANVFRLAATAVKSSFPRESDRLLQSSEQYFHMYPQERLSAGAVVRSGWVVSLPRLRDMLTRRLS